MDILPPRLSIISVLQKQLIEDDVDTLWCLMLADAALLLNTVPDLI